MPSNRWIRVFVLYMALAGGSYSIYHLVLPVRVFHHIILTAILLYWVLEYGFPTHPLIFPLGAFLAVAGISCLYAVNPRMAWENLWHWIVNSLLFLLLVDWIRQERGETLFQWQFIAGGIIVGISLLEWLLQPGERLKGPFMLTNLTGAYTAAMVIPAFVWARSASNPKQAKLLGALGIGLLFVLLGGNNRGAYLSLGVGLGVFAILEAHKWRKWLVVLGCAAAFITPLLITYMTFSNPERLSGDVLRNDLWRAGAEMMGTHITGVGPGLFGQVYREIRHIQDDRMLGAHNLYLNLGAELGIGGVIAGAAVLMVFLFLIPRQRTGKQNACLAALVGVAAHMLVDNFPVQNYTFLVNLYAAYLVADVKVGTVDPHFARSLKNAAVIVVFTYGLWFLHLDRAQFHYEQSLNGDLAEAQLAAALDPDLKLYQIQVARLQDGPEVAMHYDPTLTQETNLFTYGLVAYGRLMK